MTATDSLRAMLDGRVVEWTAYDSEYIKETCWTYMGELTAAFTEYYDGTTRFDCDTWCFTPAQAIEATLGAGTCHDKCSRFNAWVCSECNATVLLIFDDFGEPSYSVDGIADVPHFCPNCGAKVVR